MLHHIQKDILNTLATSETRRYGALKPADLDGNVFGYHLKSLIRDKYIAKSVDGDYQLTQIGREYIINRYENPLLRGHSILLIVVRRGDTWLIRERLVQPLLGMAGFVHGEPVAGEAVVATAQKRLRAKTGIDIELAVRGSGLITIKRGDAIASYSHAVILYGQTDQNITIDQDATGRNFWLAGSELDQPALLPSCQYLIDQLTSQTANLSFDQTYTVK